MFLLKKLNISKLIYKSNISIHTIKLMEPSSEYEVSEKLIAFRKFLAENNIDAYVIPHSDPHQVKNLRHHN